MQQKLLTAVVAALVVLCVRSLESVDPVKVPDIFYPPKYCVPECSNYFIERNTAEAERKAAEVELKKFPAIQQEIEKLQSQEVASLAGKIRIPAPSRCPCQTSKCRAQQERTFRCGKCRIFWPFGGLINTKCSRPNSPCKLGYGGCGCLGGCNAWGPQMRWVVLYCPGNSPTPFVIKQVRVCTNCCCQSHNPYIKG